MDTLTSRRRAFYSWLDALVVSSRQTVEASRRLLAETAPMVRTDTGTVRSRKSCERATAAIESLKVCASD